MNILKKILLFFSENIFSKYENFIICFVFDLEYS